MSDEEENDDEKVIKRDSTKRDLTKLSRSPTHHRENITDWKEDFFTKPDVIEQCADLAIPYIEKFLKQSNSDLIYMDCSAGKNQFAQLLNIPYIAVDLHKYPESEGKVIYQDWLTTTRKQFDLHHNDAEIVLGLNPPFGKRYHLLNAFMNHAHEEFQPRFIFLICPEKYKLPQPVNKWYALKHQEMLPNFAFYRPANDDDFDFPCDFQVYERRKEATLVEASNKVLKVLNHPGVTICKVHDIDPDHLLHPERTLFVRRWGRTAGRTVFECNRDGTVSEFKDLKLVDTFPSWLDRGLSGKMFFCVLFQERIDRKQFRKALLQAWQEECPRMFIEGNDAKFTVSKGFLSKVVHDFLS